MLEPLPPFDNSEEIVANGAFVFQHLMPVADRRDIDQHPFDVASDTNRFGTHGR